MPAGSGEQVDQDFANYVQRQSTGTLENLKNRGLSDQRVAYINSVISSRSVGGSSNVSIRGFQQSRSVAEVRPQTQSLPTQSLVTGGVQTSSGEVISQQEANRRLNLARNPSYRGGFQTQVTSPNIVSPQTRVPFSPASSSQQQNIQKQNYASVSKPVKEKKVGNLFGFSETLSTAQSKLQTKAARGEKVFISNAALTGIGAAKVFTGTAESVLNPKRTAKSVVETIKNPAESYASIKQRISISANTNPSGFTGEIIGNVLLIKTPDLIVKASDVYRTRGLLKLETENIVAPEYFKGQTYPTIRRGQSAGQLLEEFKPALNINQPTGDLRGFTAAPKPFKSNTIALRGTSEFPGVYQAPKVSPQFLKVSGIEGRKGFSLRIFDTFRPSVMKIRPTKFEFTPGVSGSQTRLNPLSLSEIRKFFNEKAIRGRSYIPFQKTEKEAIIPYGTQLKLTQKRFYFKFKNRRIPIYEFEAIEETTKNINKFDTIEIKKALSSYNREAQSRGVVTPYQAIVSTKDLETNIPELKSFSSSSRVSAPINIRSIPFTTYKPSSSRQSISSRTFPKLSSSGVTSNKVFEPVIYPSSRAKVNLNKRISSPSRASSLRSPPRNSFSNLKYFGNINIVGPKIKTEAPRRTPRISFKSKSLTLSNYVQGYRPFVIRKGKRVYLGKALPRGYALRKAETEALKSLRATFGAEPTNIKIKGADINYKEPEDLFRSYRIKQGKKIKLKDTFIQKRGKRLVSKSEISEIQQARRFKL